MDKDKTLDVFPTVSVGIGYGKLVDNFEPDMLAIAENLHMAGLTDDQIKETRINFSDASYPREKETFKYGDYNHWSKTITIYGTEGIMESIEDSPGELPEVEISNTLAHELEHRVADFDTDQKKANKVYHRKVYLTSKRALATFAISGVAGLASANVYTNFVRPDASLAEIVALACGIGIGISKSEKTLFRKQYFEEYLNHPEEIRARSTKINKNLVKISTKEL